MEFSTPGGIYPTGLSIADSETAFVLGHPVADGPVDVDTSIIFHIHKGHPEALRIFRLEVTAIALYRGTLFVVDSDCGMHGFSNGTWQDWEGIGGGVDRINALRMVEDSLYGLASDGLIYRWEGGSWADIVDEIEDLYLYDMAAAVSGATYVSGERGHFSRLEGRQLVPIELPTNVDISSILPLDDGRFLLTGWRATVLLGSTNELLEIDAGGRTAAFANAVIWDGKILIAAADSVLELSDSILVTFSDAPAQRLAAGYGHLWKQSDSGVAVFEDGNWKDITLVADL